MTLENVNDLYDLVTQNAECEVYPSVGLPNTESEHQLPEDLKEFYSLCGGALLYKDSEYQYEILSPSRFELANPILIGEKAEYDITSTWYLIISDPDSRYLTIDCSIDRLGRCYDSFADRHGIVGSCPVIAHSFTDLLSRLIANQGKYPYWLQDQFVSLGDAYD